MTVKQLIEKLKEFPEDMPVATWHEFSPSDADNPNFVDVKIVTWTHNNYPYDKPDCDYVNLE